MLARLARSFLKDVEQTPRVSAPNASDRARAMIERRPILIAVLLTLVWHAVLFALADTIASLQSHSFPDLGYTLINLGAAAIPVGLILWLGWTRSAGLTWRRPERSWWLLTPLVLEALSYAVHGVLGSVRELVSGAVLYAALGISEEAISRGLVQRVLAALGPVRAAVGTGLLFGAGHILSGIWFSHPVGDTIYISINAAAFGFALAALRWHLQTIWPLAALHGLGDFTQILSPGNLPFTVRVAYMFAYVGYGCWLLRRLPGDGTGPVAAVPPASSVSGVGVADHAGGGLVRQRALRLAVVALVGAAAAGCGQGPRPVSGERSASISVPAGSQRAWCAGTGPAVVLISGIGDDATSAQWVEVERALAKDTHVCRYDRPGTGASRSPATAGRGADELVKELDTVVDHAAARANVILVAHSYGGYLALLYANRHPDRVSGLVLVDALDPAVGVLRGTGASTLAEVAMAQEQLDLGDVERAAKAVTELAGDPPVVVLSREKDSTAAWTAGQQHLAALSRRSAREVADGAGHQVPSEAPQAVVAAVKRLRDQLVAGQAERRR